MDARAVHIVTNSGPFLNRTRPMNKKFKASDKVLYRRYDIDRQYALKEALTTAQIHQYKKSKTIKKGKERFISSTNCKSSNITTNRKTIKKKEAGMRRNTTVRIL